MDRRTALKAIAGTAASLGAYRSARAVVPAAITPGLQLYTVRSAMQQDVEATLARVAAIGYREVEFAGYFGRPPRQVASLLSANGLTAPATHLSQDVMRKRWDEALDESATIGHRWVVVPSIAAAERGTLDNYKRVAAEFNVAAARAKARGLSFAYHNHDFELKPLGGTSGLDVLLQECDPALVSFELDLYWLAKGGRDAVRFVTQHPGRFPLVHVKDMATNGAMAEVGKGQLPFQRIFDAARGGIRHFFVEHDNPASPFDSITTSLAALRRLSA